MIKIQSTVHPEEEHTFNQIAINAREESNILRFGKSMAEIKRLSEEQKIRDILKKAAIHQFNAEFNKQTR